jgi:hypothetical protein
MESAWQTVQQFANTFYAGAKGVISAAEPWQVLLVVAALILMVLFLAIGLRVANRSGEAAGEELAEHAQKLQLAEDKAAKAEEKASKAEEEVVKAEEEKREALKTLESEKNRQLSENNNQMAVAKTRIEQLERMQIDETAFLAGARVEAARIVRDAKDYAYTVASRADAEYAEMMRHANEEAENLRALSQQRLDQAHDTLKKALNRATEIIAEAHAEGAHANRPWYEAPPARLMDVESSAPNSSDSAQEEPAAPTSAVQDT